MGAARRPGAPVSKAAFLGGTVGLIVGTIYGAVIGQMIVVAVQAVHP